MDLPLHEKRLRICLNCQKEIHKVGIIGSPPEREVVRIASAEHNRSSAQGSKLRFAIKGVNEIPRKFPNIPERMGKL